MAEVNNSISPASCSRQTGSGCRRFIALRTPAWTLRRISSSEFVVVEMQRQWHVVGCGIGATQGGTASSSAMCLKGPRCSGEDHRRLHFTAHFEDCLHRRRYEC
ncbi:hypothetical protein ACLK1T_16395 [Escherichia coli]